jgi:hypothetical protein
MSKRQEDNAPEPSTPRRGLDPELQAMAKLDRIMAEVPEVAVT